MKRRDLLALASWIALPSLATAKLPDPKLFEGQVKNGVRVLHEWTHFKRGTDGLWQKQWLLVSSTKYDVVKSESALRPLIGTLQTTVVSMFGVKHADRSDAEVDRTVEDAPSVPGGKNAYTLEYELKFEPTRTGWSFLEGKARTSMQLMLGRESWVELSASDLRQAGGMHGHVVRAFAASPTSLKKSPPPKRVETQT